MPNTCICENSKYLKSIVENSVICDEIVSVTDSVSTNVTNMISTNVMSTVSINSGDKKVRYIDLLYFAHFFIGNHIAIYDHHYSLSLCKTQIKTRKCRHMNNI